MSMSMLVVHNVSKSKKLKRYTHCKPHKVRLYKHIQSISMIAETISISYENGKVIINLPPCLQDDFGHLKKHYDVLAEKLAATKLNENKNTVGFTYYDDPCVVDCKFAVHVLNDIIKNYQCDTSLCRKDAWIDRFIEVKNIITDGIAGLKEECTEEVKDIKGRVHDALSHIIDNYWYDSPN